MNSTHEFGTSEIKMKKGGQILGYDRLDVKIIYKPSPIFLYQETIKDNMIRGFGMDLAEITNGRK